MSINGTGHSVYKYWQTYWTKEDTITKLILGLLVLIPGLLVNMCPNKLISIRKCFKSAKAYIFGST